jgi:hypothetical protein
MNQTERILKQDAAGRVWTPREQREAALDEFERSGLPATKFAVHIGVKYSTFVAWVQKRRKARGGGGAGSGQAPAIARLAGWVEAAVEAAADGRTLPLVVHLPGGARVEVVAGAQVALAAQLLRALGEAGGVGC